MEKRWKYIYRARGMRAKRERKINRWRRKRDREGKRRREADRLFHVDILKQSIKIVSHGNRYHTLKKTPQFNQLRDNINTTKRFVHNS